MSLPLTKEQEAWLERTGKKITHVIKTKDPKINPCIVVFGNGPAEICKNCSHLYRIKPGVKIYLKCDLREETHGAGTDHHANWPACGKFSKIVLVENQ